MGQALNKLRHDVERALEIHLEKIQVKDQTPTIMKGDVTLPEKSFDYGSMHPLRLVRREMEDICVRMGFEIIDGPEVETEYYNFRRNLIKGWFFSGNDNHSQLECRAQNKKYLVRKSPGF